MRAARHAGRLVGILAGLAILRWPGLSALFVLYLVAFWAIMMGIVRIVGAIADHEVLLHAWLVALAGIVSVLFGIAMFAWPRVGLLTLVYLVGIYAIVYGVIACMIAFRLRSLPERLAGTLMLYSSQNDIQYPSTPGDCAMAGFARSARSVHVLTVSGDRQAGVNAHAPRR